MPLIPGPGPHLQLEDDGAARDADAERKRGAMPEYVQHR
eukprot:SAG11_NODE_38706_length_251_cov_0.677632_1_plen_38_part_10